MKYRTRWYRKRALDDFGHAWKTSLEGLGTCTYYGIIPVSAITRIAFVGKKNYFDLVLYAGIDPMITLINYRLVGEKYRHSVKRLFGDTEEAYTELGFQLLTPEQQQQAIEQDKQLWSNGIEIKSMGELTCQHPAPTT